MASRAHYETLGSSIERLSLVSCRLNIGASGQIFGIVGDGISYVQPGGIAGSYAVRLQDPYKYLVNFDCSIQQPAGTPVVVTSAGAHLVVGNVYTITTVGTTTAAEWILLGLDASLANANGGIQVGMPFVALKTGQGTGTGQVAPFPTGDAAAVSGQILGAGNSSATTQLAGTPDLGLHSSNQALLSQGYILTTIAGISSGPMVVGETVTGGTSGATGVLLTTTNPLQMQAISGTFVAGETVTGGVSSATAVVASYTQANLQVKLGGLLLLQTLSPAGAGAWPASGAVVRLNLWLRNSSTKNAGYPTSA